MLHITLLAAGFVIGEGIVFDDDGCQTAGCHAVNTFPGAAVFASHDMHHTL